IIRPPARMHKLLFSLLVLLLLAAPVTAQTTRQLRKVMELKMPRGGGDNGGTVALNLKNRNYYATVAGNKTYSMAFFNGAGEMVSPPDLAVLQDIRGLWYSPAAKTFHANSYGTNGWYSYTLDDAGIPYDIKPLFPGQLQPFPNSTGAYNLRANTVYFLKGSAVVGYDAATGAEQPQPIVVLKAGYGRKTPPPAGWSVDTFQVLNGYNSTTLVFTGVANSEFGLLNVKTREVELYSGADGLMSQRLTLPPDAPVRDKLNFAYCNNTYWLYHSTSRTWIGYR
ncbi:MAG TPA: hypothetical protein PKE63_02965, partial [Lacibacter sp.]|nr:hypothetical protein [Lacibacter sp.]